MTLVESLLAHLYSAPFIYSLVGVAVSMAAYTFSSRSNTQPEPNPFETDSRRKRQPINKDKEFCSNIIKQGFSPAKVPQDLDAIVIGSGIGGLCTAALLAKTGKKVLVLEQHGKAGGCCHTFSKKGFEFDTGIHYVGKLHTATVRRTLLDQISYGQIQWQALDDNYDTVVLGRGESQKKVHLKCGDQFRQSLLDAFPQEAAAVDKFLTDLRVIEESSIGLVLLKTLPLWAAQLLLRSRLLDLYCSYTKYASLTTRQYLDNLTDNEELKAVLAYNYGDFGTCPSQANILMNVMVYNHFKMGSAYPVGGGAQIPLNIIPVIEDAGGKVLVKARVTKILTEGDRAVGVRVSSKSKETVDIYAPIIVSDAGVLNTKAMLPTQVFAKSHLSDLVADKRIQNGYGSFTMFVGLNGTAESLGLKAQNIWAFRDIDLDAGFKKLTKVKDFDARDLGEVPLIFLSFPSAKDPDWSDRRPGKSTAVAITIVSYDWFEPWANEKVKQRGETYSELKDAIGKQMWAQILELYPQLEDKVEYFDVASPLTNSHYIAANRGEMYGLDHNVSRFSPEVTMKLRPDIGIPGLYLTGQDIVTCGFTSAMTAGLLTASVILGRNIYADCEKLHNKLVKEGSALELLKDGKLVNGSVKEE